MPKISVVIAHFNHGKYIDQCVDSVLNQTFQDFEIILWDDCSTEENIIDILKRQEAKDKRVKLYLANEKTFANGEVVTNKCISKSYGEYIFPLDSDNWLTPICLEILLEPLEKGLGDFSYPKLYSVTESNTTLTIINRNYTFDPKRLIFSNNIDMGGMYKRRDFDKVGGYNKNVSTCDWEFWLNMVSHNLKGIFVNDFGYVTRIHSKQYTKLFNSNKNLHMLERLYINKRYNLNKDGKIIRCENTEELKNIECNMMAIVKEIYNSIYKKV